MIQERPVLGVVWGLITVAPESLEVGGLTQGWARASEHDRGYEQ